jgi:Flp pilus assembly protein TadG
VKFRHYIRTHRRLPPALRAGSRRGAEMLEFTLVLLPLLAIVAIIMNTAWVVFARSTLQRACQVGVRTGITLTAGQMASGATLTGTVKSVVQSNSLGLLSGSSGLAKIKIHFFLPPDSTSSLAATDVSGLASGNAPGNIMQVSVERYPLVALMPRIFTWKSAADTSSIYLTVYSADRIEPSSNPPTMGTAP